MPSYETSAALGLIKLQLNAVKYNKPKSSNTRLNVSPENKEPSINEYSPDKQISEKPLRELQEKYPKVFQGIGQSMGHKQDIHIDESVPPVAQTYSRVPFHLRKQLDSWLKAYTDKGIIEPVTDESAGLISGLAAAPKPRNLNEVRA